MGLPSEMFFQAKDACHNPKVRPSNRYSGRMTLDIELRAQIRNGRITLRHAAWAKRTCAFVTANLWPPFLPASALQKSSASIS